MNERTLIGQSAMVYCASKLLEACPLNYDIKVIDHKIFTVFRLIKSPEMLEEFVNHELLICGS